MNDIISFIGSSFFTALIVFFASWIVVPIFMGILRLIGFYAIVEEGTCHVYVLFGKVTEMHSGPLRWYAFDPAALDSHVAVLAVTAAILTFRFHRSLIEVIGVMALLGIITQFGFTH